MNNMTLFPQATNKTPETLEDVQKMLDFVCSQLTAIGQEASTLHQELTLLKDAVDKEAEDEAKFEAKLEDNAEKVSPVYKLAKADFRYVDVMGEFWFDRITFKALTGKDAGAMTGFIHRIRHAEESKWTVNTKRVGRNKIYQIVPKETALYDAA